MRVLLPLAILLLAATPSVAADRPLAGDSLRLHDRSPSQRTVRFRATDEAAVDLTAVDPRVAGARFEVIGRGLGDGSSSTTLPAAGWTGLGTPSGSKGYRFRDSNRTSGVRAVLFARRGNKRKLVVSGGGEAWSYGLASAQAGPLDVRLTIGTTVYCARFLSFLENEPGNLTGKGAAPPPNCAFCGNGSAEAPVEECDDGNGEGGDGCSADCQLEDASAVCDGIPAVAGTTLDKVLVASGLTQPVYVTAPPLDPNRLFIVEKPGTIRVVENGVLLPVPFLDLTGQVSLKPEQGLLSMAFDPGYESNGFFYISYTEPVSPFTGICAIIPPGGGDSVLARFQVSADPNVANASSKVVLLTIDQPDVGHNGGLITFGAPDGYLYFGLGDGENPGDPCETAQNDLSPLGKLLRIDVHASPPIDPVASIWAKGFRNPWRFSFDRLNGDLYVGDVGQATWEEVSYQPWATVHGANFQWDEMEGRHCFEPATSCDPSGTSPVLEYGHVPACAVTGGYVYRGCAMPDLRGTYFYTDYCNSLIKSFRGVSDGDAQNLMDHPELASSLDAVVSFGEDARGEIYLVDFGDIPGTPGHGQIFRIVPGS